MKTTLAGGATSIVIETASGVTFLDSADVTIGGTSLVHANIESATNNGATTSVVIQTDDEKRNAQTGRMMAMGAAPDMVSITSKLQYLFLYKDIPIKPITKQS